MRIGFRLYDEYLGSAIFTADKIEFVGERINEIEETIRDMQSSPRVHGKQFPANLLGTLTGVLGAFPEDDEASLLV